MGTETGSADGADETSIRNATVFVYQDNGSEEVLYQTISTESSSIDAQLYFNDQTEYTYRFEAYANMGELDAVPVSVSFSGESTTSLQMHGTLDGIDADSSPTATVSMERYVGRVLVCSVTLNWKNSANASYPFTLKKVYLANMAQTLGGAAYYNIDGNLVSTDKDALLVSEVNQVIENKGTYSVPRYLYGYGAEGSTLVLECEWAGQTMYYHLDCDLDGNGSVSYTLNIHQTGSSEPLGELTDDVLESVGTMISADWTEVNKEASFGEAPATPVGASIYGINGKFYSADEWTASGKSNEEAVGVAVSDGEHSFVIHPTAEKSGLMWSSNISVTIDGVFTTTDVATAKGDFAGAANTTAILAAVQAGTIADAPAAQYAAGITFANGKTGYLLAAGELELVNHYLSDINSCLTAIGGTALSIGGNNCWSSTQHSDRSVWRLPYTGKGVLSSDKDNTYYVLVVSAL